MWLLGHVWCSGVGTAVAVVAVVAKAATLFRLQINIHNLLHVRSLGTQAAVSLHQSDMQL